MPASAVQGEHQAGQGSLAQRVFPVQPLELWDKLRPCPQRQSALEQRFSCAEPELVQTECVAECRKVAIQLRPRRTTAQTERLLESRRRGAGLTRLGGLARSSYQLLEFVDIKLTRLDPQHVAAILARDPIVAQQLAQPVDVRVQGLPRARRWPIPPGGFHQLISFDDAIGVQQQQRQQPPLLAPSERERVPVARDHLERPQHQEAHREEDQITCSPARCQIFASHHHDDRAVKSTRRGLPCRHRSDSHSSC